MKKSKTAILISSIVVGFLLIVVGVFLLLAFVFPYKLAHDVYDLGFNTYAYKLYVRAYDKDKNNVDALYMALNLSIKLGDNEGIETHFEEFSSKENYNLYVSNIDKANAKKDANVLIKSTLLNEDNYLKNRYVMALVSQNKFDKAIEFCKNSIIESPSTFVLGNYYYANFAKDAVNKADLQFLLDDSVYSEMQSYFSTLSADFKSSFALDKLPERVCAGNRIITVGSNLLYFNSRFENTLLSNEEVGEIVNIIESTKQAVNLLLME